jgi:predicted nucleotidyltransferase
MPSGLLRGSSHKNKEAMINKEILEEVKKRLIGVYDPVAIYIFGSYAWGIPTEDSDLDLLIVVDASNEKSYSRLRPGQRALFGLGISKDLIVYTKDEFERISCDVTTLGYKIKKDGKVLYARA